MEVYMTTKALTRTNDFFPSVFEDFLKPWNEMTGMYGLMGKTFTMPAVNITEDKDFYKISLAAPGLEKKDFNIDVEGNMLTISSEKEEKKEEKNERLTRKEYNFSSFSRSFTLPEAVITEKIEAVYEGGELKVMLPKKDEAKKAIPSKHITIK
jgi:HSP20 family protein